MMTRVEWLPVGHIPHGYRRVFIIHQEQTLRHVVNVIPMPYEQVYHIRELGKPDDVADPSLWWGLSVIFQRVSQGILLGLNNPDSADDGYIQLRPDVLTQNDMVPISVYQTAFLQGRLTFACHDGAITFKE